MQESLAQAATQSPLAHLAAIIEVFSLYDGGKAAYYQKLKRAILRESRRNLDTDSQAILRALHEGLATRQEIATHTGIPAITVHNHLQRLRRQKLVVRRQAPKDQPGKGGDRKTFLYWPAE